VEILILDEPTAVLTPSETKDLFGNLQKLREAGRTIVFISHKLDEVMEIADRITVLRRGKVVGETRPAETSKAKLAEMMVGRPVLFRLEKPTVQIGEPVLRVQDLTGEGKLNGVSFEVRAGEILGVAGVEGNGQRELAETLIGLRTPASGSIELQGAAITGGRGVRHPQRRGRVHPRGPARAGPGPQHVAMGERRARAPGRRRVLRGARCPVHQEDQGAAARLVKTFDIRTRSVDVAVSTLSGGNQQKLILARELETDPKLMIAAQPTRGLDVGAIEFVWKQILDQKAAGRGVLLISAELDEIYALSDRIVTLYEGKITGEFPPDAPPEQIGIGMLGRAPEEAA
jgi:simple sugar transport system ATP-binding protein